MGPSGDDALAVLARMRTRPRPRPADEERCDVCADPIDSGHGHLVDIEMRSLRCACRGCHLLFQSAGAGQRYRSVPTRYRVLDGPPVTAADWDSFQIPVGVAFLFVNSRLGETVAFYPGPAGATESTLALGEWARLAADRPVLETVLPDVEAVLVRLAPGASTADAFVVPIDACYELVGTLRRLWRGFDGGGEARTAIDDFFAKVRERSS